MTELLEQAFAAAANLLDSEQDALATIILEELISEQRWQQAFTRTGDVLAQLADKALAEHHAGRTQVLDPDQL